MCEDCIRNSIRNDVTIYFPSKDKTFEKFGAFHISQLKAINVLCVLTPLKNKDMRIESRRC